MKEEILRLAEERARTDAALRKKSDMVQLYYDELEKECIGNRECGAETGRL